MIDHTDAGYEDAFKEYEAANKLTAKKVYDLMLKCLFKDKEKTKDAVLADSVMLHIGFHPKRLKDNIPQIAEMLAELPEGFRQGSGDGASFLTACARKDGSLWGQHKDIDALLALGLAAGLIEYKLPREQWTMLPGGMPYFMIKAPDNAPVPIET